MRVAVGNCNEEAQLLGEMFVEALKVAEVGMVRQIVGVFTERNCCGCLKSRAYHMDWSTIDLCVTFVTHNDGDVLEHG